MNIFLITSEVPFKTHSREGISAVHIVIYEIIRCIRAHGHDVTLQILFNEYRSSSSLDEIECQEIQLLNEMGLHVLPPIFPSQYLVDNSDALSKMRRLLFGVDLCTLYPSFRLRDHVKKLAKEKEARAILTLWSPEGVAATHQFEDIPRLAYHGDIDFMPGKARLANYDLFFDNYNSNSATLSKILYKYRAKYFHSNFEKVHVELMNNVTCIANVTASNADYYTSNGHPDSVYIPNVWSETQSEGIEDICIPSNQRAFRIIGHVGSLGQTGSAFGLKFLLEEIVPALKEKIRDINYEVYVIGGGNLVAGLRKHADRSDVIFTGFIEDLESELKASDVILMLNNVGYYKAAYTRHLVAWSKGLCLIAHSDSKLAIPEIQHEYNALLGSNAEEIAQNIRSALVDRDLNLRIRRNGLETYKSNFTPEIVVSSILKKMEVLTQS